MSRIPQASGKGVPPRTGGIPRPSASFRPPASSTMRETGSKSRISSGSTTAAAGGEKSVTEKPSKSSLKKPCPAGPKKPTKKKEKKETEFVLPALSTLKRQDPTVESELDKIKKKTVRRNAPQGEDIKMIKEIMKNVKDQEITVHEFVGLVAPYTGDNGTALRTILASELSHFRVLARKIYDNMTQDVSDVLTNEHIQLTEVSKERHDHYSDKMMRAIDEIFEYCPDFDFEKYYTDREYLERMFPEASDVIIDEDTGQLLLRQEAYHRMMWLRSEGERLAEENKRLNERLKELKKRQKEEMMRAAMIDQHNEHKRKELEQTQEALQEQLEDMNNSIEKAIVEKEKSIREEEDVMPPPPPVRKPPKPAPRPKKRAVENWNVKTAAAIEEASTTETLVAETSRVSLATSSTGTIPKVIKPKKSKTKKAKFKKPPSVPQDADPFHYSPPRTPPGLRERPRSPFHFSPPKTPPGFAPQEERPTETTRVSTTTRTLEQPQSEARTLPAPRRSLAPTDTWTGFM